MGDRGHDELSEINRRIGLNIRIARERASISRNILARAINATVRRIEQIEAGEIEISVSDLFFLSLPLKVGVESFFETPKLN
jgi:transcriptional regulator with XRE-family HTH domain